MNKYYPLFWDRKQIKCLIYRIYINILSIFLGIKILPLKIDKRGIEIYFHGDTVKYLFQKVNNRRWCSFGFSGNGDFGLAMFDSLQEINKAWDEYFQANLQIKEKMEKDF